MNGFRKRLRGQWFRLLLVVLSLGLIAGGVAVMFQSTPASAAKPAPLPVAANEFEIVWLYGATNTSAWERFVAAVQLIGERLRAQNANLEVEAGAPAFPRETTAVPEVALKWRDTGTRLVFRWYKLTHNWKTRDWLEALSHRQPPPLAVIGGSSSDGAREVATQMERVFDQTLPEDVAARFCYSQRRPADRVTAGRRAVHPERAVGESPYALPSEDDGDANTLSLMDLYRRTFRYCFTNRQMAVAATQFIWLHDDLRPDSDPVHMVRWEDDAYSRDLIDGFWRALRLVVARSVAREWGWTTGCLALGAPPPSAAGGFAPSAYLSILPTPQSIPSSVGTFLTPNRFEAEAARYLLDDARHHPEQRRPLLIVSGQSQPSRRFLRALARTAPDKARQFVVAAGDTIPFNTLYRDRQVTWPIQDLPFSIVSFCHFTTRSIQTQVFILKTAKSPVPRTCSSSAM